MPETSQFGTLSDLVARCVLAFERAGDAAVDAELARHPDIAAGAREQLEALRRAGLLVPPEQPTAFGPYRVVRQLGTGGMGTVWLCEQQTPVRRLVAVKVLRPGVADAELLVRFQLEREALARLTDPCIARVLDAGVTADRRPYLVMDYVPGTAITQFCDDRRLTLRQRLELFARLCDAVQHAHHKGIVHRDLKPGNVLVIERDGEPLPVVIDFGVAKSVSTAPGTVFTIEGKLLGTPEYMSPEQARGEPDIDTRADIYSLGVLLYELLTGALPIDSTRLRNLVDLGRVLHDFVPPRASARFVGLAPDDRQRHAAARATTPPVLERALRRELDWILLHALEKDRNRRYGTPAEFALDVRHHLACEPIAASPPSRWLAARRFCERHRLPIAALVVAVLALCTLTGMSFLFWREAAVAERTATAVGRRLEQNLDSALSTLDEIVSLGVDGLRTAESAPMRDRLLHSALDLHEKLIRTEGIPDQRLSAALAHALARAADLHDTLGETGAALPLLERSEATLAELAADPQDQPATFALGCARAHSLCGRLRAARGQHESARAHFEAALAAFDRAAARGMDPHAMRCDRLTAIHEFADLLADREVEAASAQLGGAAGLAREVLADAHATFAERTAALFVLGRLAWLRCETGQAATARDLVREASTAAAPSFAPGQPLTARLLLAPVLRMLTRVALRLRDRATLDRTLPASIATLREAIAAEPAVPSHRQNLAMALAYKALDEGDTASPTELDAIEFEAIDLLEKATHDGGDSSGGRALLLDTLLNYCIGRMDWLAEDRLRDAFDAGKVAATLARADAVWKSMPENLTADRHVRESWTGSFRVRAGLAGLRGDAAAQRRALADGVAFTRALLAEHPDIIQVRLIDLEMQFEFVRATAEIDPQSSWAQAMSALDGVLQEARAFAVPTLWPRLWRILDFAIPAMRAVAARSQATQRDAVAARLRALADLADTARRGDNAATLRRFADDLGAGR
ncbi:MAG: serine/threonine-protein kinase [Planctomycetota bacterium]